MFFRRPTSVLPGSSLTQTQVLAGFGSGMVSRTLFRISDWNVNGLQGGKMLRTDFVHGSVVAHVDKINVHLDNVLEAAPCFFQDILDVFKDLLLLRDLARSRAMGVHGHLRFGRPRIPRSSCWSLGPFLHCQSSKQCRCGRLPGRTKGT